MSHFLKNLTMQLKLTRPLAVFDLETTGTNIANDRIVEIAVLKINPDGREETRVHLVNPEMHIPAEVVAIHGIKDEDVKDKPTFKELAGNLIAFIGNSDLADQRSAGVVDPEAAGRRHPDVPERVALHAVGNAGTHIVNAWAASNRFVL